MMTRKNFSKKATSPPLLANSLQQKITLLLRLLGPAVMGVTIASTSFAAEGPISNNLDSAPENATLQLAQASQSNGPSITVAGRGRVTAPADRAVLMFISQLNYAHTSSETTDQPENVTVQAADLQPVVDALVSSGIPQSDIIFVPDSYSPQAFRLLVSVDQPTRAGLSALVDQVTTQMRETEKFMPGQTTIAYTVDSCEAFEAQARELAVADAQNQAQAMATTLNRTLGELSAITASRHWGHGYSPTVCPSDIEKSLRYLIEFGTGQPYNQLIEPETFVGAEVSITYDLE